MTIGQADDIWRVPYVPGFGAGALPLEVLSFAALREMDRAQRRRRAQRPEFHVLALVESGEGRHRADFVEHPLRPGTVVWIRPGVVHRWTDVEALEGPMLLFLPRACTAAPGLDDPSAVATWQVSGTGWDLTRQAVEHLTAEHRLATREPRLHTDEVLRLLLTALLVRVARTAPPAPPGDTAGPDSAAVVALFRRFRADVERHFTEQHQVGWYAARLGYTPRTLTRATRAAAGAGAKRLLDERIALEAMRLLAHTDLTVARCAQRLGFADAANFTTFFRRHTGRSPTAWRRTETAGPDHRA